MAVYKVPQDVEADDKFLGPLSFKQFIFAGVGAIAAYLAVYLGMLKGFWPIIILCLPLIIVCGFLAFPWGRDQPTEVWLAAKIRFMIKPRRRTWNQAGLSELVTITAPKKVEIIRTDGLSQGEVKNRLGALANMLDSRGWAVKNVNVNLFANQFAAPDSTQRLVDTASLPQEIPETDIQAADDMMDTSANQSAHHIEELMQASEASHRQQIQQTIEAARQGKPADQALSQNQDFWFLHQNKTAAPKDLATFDDGPVIMPGSTSSNQMAATNDQAPTAADQALLEHVHHDQEQASHIKRYSHLKTLQPIDYNKPANSAHKPAVPPTQPTISPVNAQLAARDDLNISVISNEASRAQAQTFGDDEVVVQFEH
jgi:PrgI family protein